MEDTGAAAFGGRPCMFNKIGMCRLVKPLYLAGREVVKRVLALNKLQMLLPSPIVMNHPTYLYREEFHSTRSRDVLARYLLP